MSEKSVPELITEIAQKSGKSEEEVKALIDAKVAKFSGLLTDNGAAFMVQKELGIRQEVTIETKINELQEGMKGIEVKGAVLATYPVKEFEKTGKKGKLKSFLLSDGTGEVRVTLWNDQVDKFGNELTKGSEIALINAVVSVYNEKKQLTLGFNGELNILSKKEEEFEKLAALKAGLNSVNIVGKIIRKFPCKEFETPDRKGKLCAFQLGDDTAIVRVTAWNEKAEEIEKYAEKSVIEIKNAYTKEGKFGVEVNIGYNAEIKTASEEKVPTVIKELGTETPEKKINVLVDAESAIITGKISSVEKGNFAFDACKKCGKKISKTGNGVLCEKCGETEIKKNAVVTFVIEDDTASVKTTFFGEVALKAMELTQEELESMINGKSNDVITAELNGKLSGKEIKVYGYLKTNNFSGENEFRAKEII